MSPILQTARLRVFHSRVKLSDQHGWRDVYMGVRIDEDRPMPCVTAMLWAGYPITETQRGYWVDWLETTTEYRRTGFATELMAALEAHLQPRPIVMSGGSAAGDRFVAAYYGRVLSPKQLNRRRKGGEA